MPKITALVHAQNHPGSLERTLGSLRLCDELIVVVDSSDDDELEKTARGLGATVRKAISGVTPGAYAMDSRNDWILVLQPNEELDETLRQNLSDWQQADHEESGYAFQVCEVTGDKRCNHLAEMRLVNKKKINWVGDLPPNNTMAPKLPGDILRYPEEPAA
jgi:glycosyltransferase involved in cell wall biosynthesis